MTPRACSRGPARAAVAVAAVTALVLLAGCGAEHHRGAAADATPSTTVGPVVTLRLGLLTASATGQSPADQAVASGVRLAVSGFDGSGQGTTVLVDTATTGGTEKGAAAAARRLLADHVAAVIGPQTTPQVEGALPILSAAHVPALIVTATQASLADRGWSSFLRVVADDQQQGQDDAWEMVHDLGLSSLAVVGGGQVPSPEIASAAATEATSLGAVVAERAVVTTSGQAQNQARQIVASAVKGVLVAGTPPVAQQLVSSLDLDGYSGTILFATSSLSPESVLAPLGAAADGTYVSSAVGDPTSSIDSAGGDSALVFIDAYRAAFGRSPPDWAAPAYDAADFALTAFASGTTSVEGYLTSHRWTGTTSVLSFAPDGDQVAPSVFVSRVKDGKLVPVATAAVPQSQSS